MSHGNEIRTLICDQCGAMATALPCPHGWIEVWNKQDGIGKNIGVGFCSFSCLINWVGMNGKEMAA